MRHWTKWLAGALALLGAVGCTSLHEKQGEWIFNPRQGSWGGSAEVSGTMEDAWIAFDSSATGRPVRLHALWHRTTRNPVEKASADEAAPLLLYLHGARWNVTGSAYRIQRMQQLGFDVLAVDYRGFGKTSDETPSEAMAYEDAMAAWQWMAQQHPQRPRYIFGHSLGGAIAIDLASRVGDERGTIVEGTFTSIRDVFQTMRWGWLPVGGLITQRFDAIDKVARIGSPLLVVHGSEDSLIKPELGQRLFDAAAEPKRFVLVPGGSHHNTNAVGQSAYRAALREFFGLKS